MRIVATARYIDTEVKIVSTVPTETETIPVTAPLQEMVQPIFVSPSFGTSAPSTRTTRSQYFNTPLDLRDLGVLTPPETATSQHHALGERSTNNSVSSFTVTVSHTNTVWFDVSDERSVH